MNGIYHRDKPIEQSRIEGHARLDDRANLIRKLQCEDSEDLQLIFLAYQRWGKDCLKHLLGDFAFVIWDSRENCLFCARDHFGMKPFFYAEHGTSFAYSSEIDWLSQALPLSRDIDEAWLGDYFVFTYCNDLNATVYKAVRRLPPAHWLRISPDKREMQRYWDLTPAKVEKDYLQQYHELFTQAVRDRLNAPNAAVMMSGGTDSTAIASVARQFVNVKAFLVVYEDLVPEDEEGKFARIVGESRGIPVETMPGDNYALYERPEIFSNSPEPNDYPIAALWNDFLQSCSAYSPVILSGTGGDLLFMPSNYYLNMMREGHWFKLLQSLIRFQKQHGSLERSNIRGQLMAYLGKKTPPDWLPPIPDWLQEDFVRRSNLRERMAALHESMLDTIWRKGSIYQKLLSPFWPSLFEYDKLPTYPFFDLRLVEFALSLPPEQIRGKAIHREAMRPYLPDAVRLRPKTTMGRSPVGARIKRNPAELQKPLIRVTEYVNLPAYQASVDDFITNYGANIKVSSCSTAPISLEFWLEKHE